MNDKHYKLKYLALKQSGGTIEKNIRITNYFDNLSMCEPNFGVDDIKNLIGRDPSSSGAYIASGVIKVDNILHKVVIKFFINSCQYKYKKRPKKQIENTSHKFISKNEIGTMLLLRDKLLITKCTPNIVWCFRGGVCKFGYKSMTCRKDEINEDEHYLFQENPTNKFVSEVITKLLENEQEENAVYEALTKDSHAELSFRLRQIRPKPNLRHIPYLIVEKCGLSYAGLIEQLKSNIWTIEKTNDVIKTASLQILLTFQILTNMFQTNDFVKIPPIYIHDGCYVEHNDEKIEIIKLINVLHNSNDCDFEMILSNGKIMRHSENLSYYCKPTFTHNDCHIGNILTYRTNDDGPLNYDITTQDIHRMYSIKHSGLIAKLWDFDTCDIVDWIGAKKYYEYYSLVSTDKLGVRIKLYDGVYMNDIFVLFNTFLNGKEGSYGGILNIPGLNDCDVIKFFKECISLGRHTNFLKLLVDKDDNYIDVISKTIKDIDVKKLSKYFDEYIVDELPMSDTNFMYNHNTHKLNN